MLPAFHSPKSLGPFTQKHGPFFKKDPCFSKMDPFVWVNERVLLPKRTGPFLSPFGHRHHQAVTTSPQNDAQQLPDLPIDGLEAHNFDDQKALFVGFDGRQQFLAQLGQAVLHRLRRSRVGSAAAIRGVGAGFIQEFLRAKYAGSTSALIRVLVGNAADEDGLKASRLSTISSSFVCRSVAQAKPRCKQLKAVLKRYLCGP